MTNFRYFNFILPVPLNTNDVGRYHMEISKVSSTFTRKRPNWYMLLYRHISLPLFMVDSNSTSRSCCMTTSWLLHGRVVLVNKCLVAPSIVVRIILQSMT